MATPPETADRETAWRRSSSPSSAYAAFLIGSVGTSLATVLLRWWYTSSILLTALFCFLVLGQLPALQRLTDVRKKGLSTVPPAPQDTELGEGQAFLYVTKSPIGSQGSGRARELNSSESPHQRCEALPDDTLVDHHTDVSIEVVNDAGEDGLSKKVDGRGHRDQSASETREFLVPARLRRDEADVFLAETLDTTPAMNIEFVHLPVIPPAGPRERQADRTEEFTPPGPEGTNSTDSIDTQPSTKQKSSSRETGSRSSNSRVLRSFGELPSFRQRDFDSRGLKDVDSFDASQSALDIASIQRALTHQTGDIWQSGALTSGSRDLLGEFRACPTSVQWLHAASTFIAAQPTPDARRRAFNDKRRQWNELQNEKTVFLASKLTKLFVVNYDLSNRNPVQIGRMMLDVRHWQSRVEQAFVGLYIMLRGCHKVLPDLALLMLVSFMTEQTPEMRVGKLWDKDDTIADLEVFANVGKKALGAENKMKLDAERFSILMSSRMYQWLGLPLTCTFTGALEANGLLAEHDRIAANVGGDIGDHLSDAHSLELFTDEALSFEGGLEVELVDWR